MTDQNTVQVSEEMVGHKQLANSSTNIFMDMFNQMREEADAEIRQDGAKESKCFYINKKLAVCAPVDPSITIAGNLLEKREDLHLSCYPIIEGKDHPEKKVEVCSTSRQEAHIQMVKEAKQIGFLASAGKR